MEELVIQHCSPTLAGMKTGSIFSCFFSSRENMRQSIRSLNKLLICKGLRVLPLRYTNSRGLIYIYRPDRLKKDLADSSAWRLLESLGYSYENPQNCIVKLIGRINENEGFPHEIGLFLGYPPEDVVGFIENKACGCKYAGCWKVYGDEEKARKTFAKYKKCTNVYYNQWLNGKSIEQLTVAV